MTRWLAFADLVRLGILSNRMTLSRWIKERGFPPGKLLGANSRRWSEAEVEAWLAAQPEKKGSAA